jgi:LAO/AO transport system kinase
MDIPALAAALTAGDRRALSRAITLVESARSDHRAQAEALFAALPPGRRALRVGLSGAPGVGKSTLIEALGLMLTGQGARVGVLAVDPSSALSGGAILGDKTRMERLARDPRAYIRPSPAGDHLGGLAARTAEVAALMEAAGLDPLLIETVGVGQSEAEVAGIADLLVLLIGPGGGDDLQGVKRGIMERADLILVTKADGDLAGAADRTAADYLAALAVLPGSALPPPSVLTVSATTGTGLAAAWTAVLTRAAALATAGVDRRGPGHRARLLQALQRAALERVLSRPGAAARQAAALTDLAEGRRTADGAARAMLSALWPDAP